MSESNFVRQTLPYMPFYGRDFMSATSAFTLAERGAYIALLCAQWDQGALPTDHSRLASIVGTDARGFKAIWPTVSRKFSPTDAGLVNLRLEEHRTNSLALKASRRRGAVKTNAKRYGGNVVPFTKGEGT